MNVNEKMFNFNIFEKLVKIDIRTIIFNIISKRGNNLRYYENIRKNVALVGHTGKSHSKIRNHPGILLKRFLG